MMVATGAHVDLNERKARIQVIVMAALTVSRTAKVTRTVESRDHVIKPFFLIFFFLEFSVDYPEQVTRVLTGS